MGVLTNSWIVDAALFLAALLWATSVFLARHYRRWMNKGIPFFDPLPFVGNMKNVLVIKQNVGEVVMEAYAAAKNKPFIGILAFHQPMLVVRDLEIVRSILVKDFNHFIDRNFSADKDSEPMIGRGLFAMKGHQWKNLRMKLTPTFTSGKMKRMFDFIDECGKDLVSYVDKYSVDGRVEVKDTMARYTTDVIASCAFGIQGNALREPNSEFRQVLSKVFDFDFKKGIKTAIGFFVPSLMIALKLKIVDYDVENYVRNTVWTTVEHRKKNGVVRKDFLDLLIQLRENGYVEGDTKNEDVTTPKKTFELEGDDFVAQAFVFLTAGFETSSTTMTFALYELSLHQDVQSRLREEIRAVLHKNGGNVTYDGIQEMTYLDMVVAETLRKYPVLPFLDRRVERPYTLPGTKIELEKGDAVVISLTGIHYDPQYYPDPQRFDPERFTEENKRSRPNYAYMPFGEGPRICIGMRMGLLQAKVGLAHLLSTYEVSPCNDTVVPLELDPRAVLLSAKGSLPLTINRVN